MAKSALSLAACAAVLAASMLLGGGAGVAAADPDGAGGATSGDGTAGADSGTGSAEGSSGSGADGEAPAGSLDSRIDDAGTQPSEPVNSGSVGPAGTDSPPTFFGNGRQPVFKNKIAIPILRLPTVDPAAPQGLLDPSQYLTTIDLPVPTIEEALAYFQPPGGWGAGTQPDDVEPVVGVGGRGVTGAVKPPALEAPVVAAAPPAVLVAGPPRVTAEVPPAVGARSPDVRLSSSSATPRVAAAPANVGTPLITQWVRNIGKYLQTLSLADIAAVALTGVAGLLSLTLSGGVIGYRQARAGRYLRSVDGQRFLATDVSRRVTGAEIRSRSPWVGLKADGRNHRYGPKRPPRSHGWQPRRGRPRGPDGRTSDGRRLRARPGATRRQNLVQTGSVL